MATNEPEYLNQSKIFNRKNNPDYYPPVDKPKYDLLPDGSKQFKLLKKPKSQYSGKGPAPA